MFNVSTKRIAISKANKQVLVVLGMASFVSIFALSASYALFGNNNYRSRVIDQKEAANKQLIANTKAFNSLVFSYKKFDQQSTNIIGGSRVGATDKDGNNARIVLDALPNSYDFPALASSLEKLLTERNLKIGNITGIDDQINQQANPDSPTPQPVEMPFSFTINDANYTSVQDLLKTLQLSIRPIQIDKMTVSGSNTDMSITVDAKTYYQPAKNLNITKKAVK